MKMEENKKSDIPVEDIGRMLDVVSEKIPHLIKSLKELIYSPQAGREMGQAVGNFYNELVNSGLDKELATELTREYMRALQALSKGMNFSQQG
jgi:hypothetical protein